MRNVPSWLVIALAALALLALSSPPLDSHALAPRPSPSHPLPSPVFSPPVVSPGCDYPDYVGIRPTVSPCVYSMAPSGDTVGVSNPISVSFSQPMDRASVAKALSLTPAAHGTWSWADDLSLSFQPYRLAHATTYTLTLGGRSRWGSALRGPLAFSFTTTDAPALSIAPGTANIKVPILMYHYIRINPNPRDILGFNLSVTPTNFAAQMDFLASHGYHTITLDQLGDFLAGKASLPAKPIVLSFDDGYADFYTAALPVLLAHDFTAVAYIVPGFWGDPSRYMTPQQVQVLDWSGIQVGSHTMNHVDLATQSPASLAYQVNVSKATLEKLLGHPVLSFCYPSGEFNSNVVAAVQAAGYRDATTTAWGTWRSLASRYIWGRLRISGGEGLASYAASVQGAS